MIITLIIYLYQLIYGFEIIIYFENKVFTNLNFDVYLLTFQDS